MKHRLFGMISVLAFIILILNGIYVVNKMSKPPLNSRDFSHADIRQEFETVLEGWATNQDFFDVYDISLECNIDELLLKRDINQKAYRNIFLYIDIFHAPVELTKEAMDYADQAFQSIYESLHRGTIYGKFIYKIEINRYIGKDKNGGIISSREFVSNVSNKQVVQSKEEKAAQKIAYDYAREMRTKKYLDENNQEQSFGSPGLIRFGIDSTTGELVIEFDMSIPSEENMEALFQGLISCIKELCVLLKEDKDALKYIKENDVTMLVVRFTKPTDYRNYYFEMRCEV